MTAVTAAGAAGTGGAAGATEAVARAAGTAGAGAETAGAAGAAGAAAAAARSMVRPEHSWQYSRRTAHSKSYKEDHCCAGYTGNIVELREHNCKQSALCTSLLCK